jgi:D-glycero-alpha-D-manno-heptose 1-phosphate guanylyltransferase
MEAIVLAGGKGTRLSKLVSEVPKPMALIGTKPFLEILLIQLSKQGFTKVILSVGYMANIIINYFGDNFMGINLVYEVEKTPLGTGGALLKAINHCTSDHVYVLNGDTFLEVESSPLEEFWNAKKRAFLVGCKVNNISRYGSLDTRGDKILGILEKGGSGKGLINAGCYVLPTDIFNGLINCEKFSFEADFLDGYIKDGNMYVFKYSGVFIDIGVPEDYLMAKEVLRNFI